MDCSVRWSVLHAKIISSPPNKNVRQMINLICSIWCTAHLQVLRWDPHLRPSFEPSLEFINFMLRPLMQKGHKGACGHKSMHDLSPNKMTHYSCSFDGSRNEQQIKRLQHQWKCQIFDWQQWRPRAPWSTDPPQVLMLCFGKGTSNDGEDHLFYTSWNRIKTRILVSFLVASTDRSWIRNGITVQAVTVERTENKERKKLQSG